MADRSLGQETPEVLLKKSSSNYTRRYDCLVTVTDAAVNKSFKDLLCHLYGEWLISGKCPPTPAGYIRRPSEAFLGMTCYQNPLSQK
jgi:hypothetical protein